MEPLLLSHAAMVLAECQLMEKSAAGPRAAQAAMKQDILGGRAGGAGSTTARPAPAAPKKPVHPRRQHTARPVQHPQADLHGLRHVGQLVKENPRFGFSPEAGAATAAVQRTPQYLDGQNNYDNRPADAMVSDDEAVAPMLHTLLQTAAGRKFSETGAFTPGLNKNPVMSSGARLEPTLEADPRFKNLMRAMIQAGAPH